MAKTLTTRALDAHPGDGPILSDAAQSGLQYRPKGKGRGNWVYRYTSPAGAYKGKRREAGLGSYPDVSLADARASAAAMAEQVHARIDPLEAKKRDEATTAEYAAHKPLTFAEAAREVHALVSTKFENPKHRAQWLSSILEYVCPTLGAVPLRDIAPRDVEAALKPIWYDKAETARRCLQRTIKILDWAVAKGHIHANPITTKVMANLLPSQRARRVHQPAVPHKLLAAFVAEHLIERSEVSRSLALFAILCAARSGEVRFATWHEIDLDNAVWSVPAERMKARRPHAVPLSSQAIELLRRLRERHLHPDLCFPSPTGKVYSDMVATELFRGIDNAPSDVPGRAPTLHGTARSSFRDWAAENGWSRELAEKALAHTVKDQTEAAYFRSSMFEQRAPMMQAWSNYLFSGVAVDAES